LVDKPVPGNDTETETPDFEVLTFKFRRLPSLIVLDALVNPFLEKFKPLIVR